MSVPATCSLCGEPMPPGEDMFKYHGYSGNCPKPPLPARPTALLTDEQLLEFWRSVQGPYAELNGPLIRFAGLVAGAIAKAQAAEPPSGTLIGYDVAGGPEKTVYRCTVCGYQSEARAEALAHLRTHQDPADA